MLITPVARFQSPMTSKFGIPRQSGLVESLPGRIVLEPDYRHEEAVRGLAEFSHLWLIWEFSANAGHAASTVTSGESGNGDGTAAPIHLTVRPPRLGGNERIGVFASRSPFRPNRLGLSAVRLKRIEMTRTLGPVIHVEGADLMDGTPIYDIKPYVAYADAHPDARSGFVDRTAWQQLEVCLPEQFGRLFTDEERQGLVGVLAQDPRPRYHDDAERVYGMPFAGRDVRFRVEDGRLTVVGVTRART